MSGSLLDTNVLSELQRPRPEPRVVRFVLGQRREDLFISTMNLVEIRYAIARANALRRAELEHWLASSIRPMFAGRVLPLNEDVMLRWRLLVDQGRKEGRVFTEPDLILAATALEHDLTLVTRDTGDFAGTGVRILNPWEWTG